MDGYYTSTIAKIIGVHPNTIRLYESVGFITPPKRLDNNYRLFNKGHISQLKVVRLLLEIELVHEGLRKEVIIILQKMASEDYHEALLDLRNYINHLKGIKEEAEEAVDLVTDIYKDRKSNNEKTYSRSKVADKLAISVDQIRNWEMNGLIDVPRKENGYRYYGDKEINALKIIKTLKYANYSLMAIRSLMTSDEAFSNSDKVKDQLDIEEYPDDIVSVYDRLLVSIDRGIGNGEVAFGVLEGLVVCE